MDNIIWSGGYDSTALLLSKFQDGNHYNVVSFYCSAVTNADDDRKAREKIKEYFRDIQSRGPMNFSFEEIEVKGPLSGTQGLIWPSLSISGVQENRPMRVFFGYIRGDDFWHYRDDIVDIFGSMSKVLGTTITPTFPFEWYYKKELVYLYTNHPTVFNNISWAGDTATVKLREKEELELIFNQIQLSQKQCPQQDQKPINSIESFAKDWVEKEKLMIGSQLEFPFLPDIPVDISLSVTTMAT